MNIFKCALAVVGITQLIKNIYTSVTSKKGKGWVWTLITIIIGSGIVLLQSICPQILMDGIIAVSGATVFYDTIYQTFEKLFKGNSITTQDIAKLFSDSSSSSESLTEDEIDEMLHSVDNTVKKSRTIVVGEER